MKRISKIVMLLSIGLVSLQANAQSVAVKSGLNFATMTEKDNLATYSDNYKMKVGYHVGVTAEMPIVSLLHIESGLFFSTKGFKLESTDLGTGSYNLNYIDIPINLKVKFKQGDIVFFGNVGPYFGIGLGGKMKVEDIPVIGTQEADIEFGDGKDLKMLDYGIGFGAGAEFKSIIFGVNYNLGLANISPTPELLDHSVKNGVFAVSVGYVLFEK